MQKMIPLKNLRFGEEHDPPLNVRKTGREIGIEELAASIEAQGLGQALNIVEEGDLAYAEDGNRRLRALHLIEKKGNITEDTLVKCEINEKDGVAFGELGLALNVQRVAMHPADQYEQFFKLHEQGKTDKEIALRFGSPLKEVRQVLAIGHVSPMILDAWRADELGHSPEETVEAFTLAPSVKDQEAVFKRLKKAHNLHPHYVKEAFGAGDRVASNNLKFVGRKAYEAAGGKIIENLFGEDHAVSDQALLAKLSLEKLEHKRDELIADGWSWASLASDLQGDWRYNWIKRGAEADKATCGAVVALDWNGKIEVFLGVEKPGKTKPKKAETQSDKPEPESLSNALRQSIAAMGSKAVRLALGKQDASLLMSVLAGVVAAQINPEQTWHTPHAVSEKLKAIRDAIDVETMTMALQSAFDRERYFGSAPKGFVIKAIKEAVGPEHAKKLASGTKAAAWKFALANVPKDWLPPELRHAGYAGPGAKAEKPKVAKPAKKAA